jgi:hypothetical protein
MWTPPKPAETYDSLVKQFRALCALTASFEAQLRRYQMDHHAEVTARSQIEGERAANQILTNEIDRLLAEIDELRKR